MGVGVQRLAHEPEARGLAELLPGHQVPPALLQAVVGRGLPLAAVPEGLPQRDFGVQARVQVQQCLVHPEDGKARTPLEEALGDASQPLFAKGHLGGLVVHARAIHPRLTEKPHHQQGSNIFTRFKCPIVVPNEDMDGVLSCWWGLLHVGLRSKPLSKLRCTTCNAG